MKIQKLRTNAYDVLDTVAGGEKPNPTNSVVMVATDEKGEVIGRIFLLTPAHIEGVWVKEQYRNQGIFTEMVGKMEQEAKTYGITTLFAYGVNEYMDRQIERLGYKKQPFTVWTKEI
jgi:N-acetylglutamate synthase-like GNAT family acetyltransferase